MFALLTWILFGFVVGVIAKLLMPGRDPGGFAATIILGIAGAAVGGYIGRLLGWYDADQSAGFLTALAGALLLLAAYRFAFARRRVA